MASTITIPGFEYTRLPGADGVQLATAIGGSGSPVVLLHGFPETHLMWRHVAEQLAAEHTVICPDLRGYGASDKPAATTPDVYAKRTMAADIVSIAAELGHERSPSSATIVVPSSRSGRDWTTRRPSRTWASSTSSRRSTCGTCCTARRPRSATTSF
jgi:hypothetical protein